MPDRRPPVDWIADRRNRMHTPTIDQQIHLEAGLCHAILIAELAHIPLTLGQATCLADVLNSTMLDASIGQIVWAEAHDAFRYGPGTYADKHGIDEAGLLALLAELGPAADHALRDAISRWWAADGDATAAGFRKMGMNIVIDPAAEVGGRTAAAKTS